MGLSHKFFLKDIYVFDGEFPLIHCRINLQLGRFPASGHSSILGIVPEFSQSDRISFVGQDQSRPEWLQWAFQKAFSDKDYQAFNKEKYMDLVDSFRDTDGARKLIKENIEIYRQTYNDLGLIF